MRERKKNFYEEETPEDQWTDIDPEEELYYEWEEKQERLRRLKEERVRVKRSIGIMIGLFCVLVVSMAGYICYYATVHKQEMFDNSYNGYQAQLQKENIRGSILASDGTVLAETVTDENGAEKRVYPFENMFAHAVGYSTKGKSGVEALANYYLINANVSLPEKVAYQAGEQKIPADNVYTTLDVELQRIAYESLGMYKGAVIVSEPSTGKILAMVSKPDFNPSTIAENWDTLIQDKNNSTLLNRVTQGLYPPGSTFKILTALEYIRENPTTYEQYSFQCTGSYSADGEKIRCYHNTVHNQVDFTKSFAKSCNSSFANIGMRLDKDEFAKTLDKLMFGEDLPIDLPAKQSHVEVSSEISNGDMMQVVIGQGTDAMTPLHLNLITNIIANDGYLMKPYLLDYVENKNHQIIKRFEPVSVGTGYMSTEETEALKAVMQEVVETGTAKKLSGLSFSAAGKTGSAEYSQNKEESHAWFTGFAPVDNPQISVTVIIESAGSGGDYAVPIAKRIMENYLTR